MQNSRLHRIKLPSGKNSGDVLYSPETSSAENIRKYHRVFPKKDSVTGFEQNNKTFDGLSKPQDEYKYDSPQSRAYSDVSELVRSNGIYSPYKWNATSKRVMLKRQATEVEPTAYLPDISSNRERKDKIIQQSPLMRGEDQEIHSTSMILTVLVLNRLVLSCNKQQMIDHIKTKSHQSYNSGRVSPLYFDRSYDSKRYMRTDDIDVKSSTSKPIIPSKHPAGL